MKIQYWFFTFLCMGMTELTFCKNYLVGVSFWFFDSCKYEKQSFFIPINHMKECFKFIHVGMVKCCIFTISCQCFKWLSVFQFWELVSQNWDTWDTSWFTQSKLDLLYNMNFKNIIMAHIFLSCKRYQVEWGWL